MTTHMILIFLVIGATSWLPPLASAQVATCSEATKIVISPPATISHAQVQELEEVATFLLSESQNPSTSCDDYIIERGLYEFGVATEKFSKIIANDPIAEKYLAGKAAEAFNQHITWWLDLDDTRQVALIKLLLRLPQNALPSDWNVRKAKWVRMRIGNAVNSLASCLIRAGKTREVLTKYEGFSTRSTEVFPAESVSEWYKWLLALPNFDREKKRNELEQLLADDPSARQHWESFATFRRQYINTNPSQTREWRLPTELEKT